MARTAAEGPLPASQFLGGPEGLLALLAVARVQARARPARVALGEKALAQRRHRGVPEPALGAGQHHHGRQGHARHAREDL
ncbi:MAG: hypothetical protein ACKOSS_03370, partial [Planctomycetia bacterium]